MNNKANILIVDDEQIVRESLLHWFEEDDYNVDTAEDGEVALKKFEKDKYDLILLDMKMPGISGLDLLIKFKEYDRDVIVILITAFASVPSAIRALKDGAYDYITKPIDPDELSHIVENALKQRMLKKENEDLKTKIDEIIKPDNLIGDSISMKKIFSLINTVAPTDTTAMIRGESGTGKELIAKAIHINSKRKYFPIITVNCGALAESILESELFGHEKGAFTGAHYKRKGKFEMANGGTIFLDEIGTISPKMQVELLRVIESKQFSRVGGNEVVKSDFRVIAATNEDLEEAVKAGRFREDLYYRLNVFTIFIPPLRDRLEDIPVLANYFLCKYANAMNKKINTINEDAMDFLIKYPWPGNVRELENAIERAVVVCKNDFIDVEDLPFHVNNPDNIFASEDKSLAAMEKRHITIMLNSLNWNISKSAEALGIDRVTLYNKISKYGLQRKS
ncbi:MAG TPA: sigma-54 dependent transcriptional regulator [Ignavibacteriaceae bacterium]|nr:sigma-54 dependent transcriptional regulator [Ignavibacteriaceae bacterium]